MTIKYVKNGIINKSVVKGFSVNMHISYVLDVNSNLYTFDTYAIGINLWNENFAVCQCVIQIWNCINASGLQTEISNISLTSNFHLIRQKSRSKTLLKEIPHYSS